MRLWRALALESACHSAFFTGLIVPHDIVCHSAVYTSLYLLAFVNHPRVVSDAHHATLRQVTLELIKLVLKPNLESYRNCFLNMAVPLMVRSWELLCRF